MKSVLISIQPKWCELIASGKKTVEVRKTKPKFETPFKCYIYCTQNKDGKIGHWLNLYCDSKLVISDIHLEEPCYELNGKVIGEFVCNNIGTVGWTSNPNKIDWKDGFNEETCLTNRATYEYTKGDKFYEWHISDLKIYDKPKELKEFCTVDNEAVRNCKSRHQSYHQFTDTGYIKNGFYCEETTDWCNKCKTKPLKRPPQSWCYVESEVTEE